MSIYFATLSLNGNLCYRVFKASKGLIHTTTNKLHFLRGTFILTRPSSQQEQLSHSPQAQSHCIAKSLALSNTRPTVQSSFLPLVIAAQNRFTYTPTRLFSTQILNCGMELNKVVSEIKDHAAVSLAESWDNVGLLVEPSAPHTVKTLLLTNDLTPPVLEEAIGQKVDFILSYHPPIFSALKQLRQSVWKERLVIKCIENRIAVYSPHTCYDAKLGGVNDWLISAFETSNVTPIEHSTEQGKYSHKINISTNKEDQEKLQQKLSTMDVHNVSSVVMNSNGDHMTISSILCQQCDISSILQTVQTSQCHIDSIDVIKLDKVPITGVGSGRVGVLKQSISVAQAVQLVKNHLKLDHVRLAAKPSNKMISSVAVCAGSGSSVLREVRADLYVTGEMSHHEVLDAVYNGSNVILCDHSNTERGYLSQVQQELSVKLQDVNIIISKTDTDPLKIV